MNDKKKKTKKIKDAENLEAIMKMIPEDKQPQANMLHDEIVYIDDLMNQLRQEIGTKGVMTTTTNYGQSFKKANPSVECYDKLSKTKHKYLLSLFKLVDADMISNDDADGFFD